eukprot:CAMPEP_0185710174 /NCGR_PEP_ID=MMETSP1164-20130828/30151_1 /TAXON_ID=1104430 /ORGANISM="Chrysoreinhardia sp, Strain CCMP2950" /LENGTH=466 /DNA_ID=CAMNT_0028377677 /DNA_START=207 /DNA_END=1610 /DNA_ORIENTATION=-
MRAQDRASDPEFLSTAYTPLYERAPGEDITLDEFENFAVDRLRVLRLLENAKAEGLGPEALLIHLTPILRKYLPVRRTPSEKESDVRKDVMSHFILRLAYSRTEELRRWFLLQECTLLRVRLEQLTPAQFEAMLCEHSHLRVGHPNNPNRIAQVKGFQPTTSCKCTIPSGAESESETYYQVPFQDATDAVAQRAALLHDGSALLPQHKLYSIIVAKFRTRLAGSLATAAHTFPSVASDPRLKSLLNYVSKHDVVASSRLSDVACADQGSLALEQLDDVANKSMPLCMRATHAALRRNHKLKHWGRIQYGLFLKAAGLSMRDQLKLFELEFTKVMTSEQFHKEYAYGIRHRYGNEGKRTDYTSYGCYKIITEFDPSPGDTHGCPFKHRSPEQLSAILAMTGLQVQDQRTVLQLALTNNFQVACQKHFEFAHPGYASTSVDVEFSGVGNHPNAWFKASRQYHTAKSKQ